MRLTRKFHRRDSGVFLSQLADMIELRDAARTQLTAAVNLSNLPGCWPSMTPGERDEALELLDLLEANPPAPVGRAAQSRLREILDTATARDRRLWHLQDPAMPTLLSA
jgi:hypothetical protein